MNKSTLKPSEQSVSRLSLYRDAVIRFKSYGAAWIMSEDIASSLEITASQVRKDFSFFKIHGKRKAGYSVLKLLDSINRLLGKTDIYDAVIAGSSSLAYSLLHEKVFAKQNIRILAVFDDNSKNPDFFSGKFEVPVLPFSSMIEFIKNQGIRFGVITSEPGSAQRVADSMIIAGIQGILSLSMTEIKVPSHVVLNSINFAHELEHVIYTANNGQKKKKSINRKLRKIELQQQQI